MKQEDGRGITIAVQVPVGEPALFKNKATGDLLSILSRHRFDEFTIGELARRTGHTKPTVGRAVDHLEGNDLVLVEPDGNRRLVRINRKRLSVPNDPFLQIPQHEFQEPVRAAVDELRGRLDALLGVVLYGSVARGEADRRSDVDLWVLVGENRAESQRVVNRVVCDLEAREFETGRYAYDVDVEAVATVPRYTEDVREIVLTGIPVYETAEFGTVRRLLLGEAGDGE